MTFSNKNKLIVLIALSMVCMLATIFYGASFFVKADAVDVKAVYDKYIDDPLWGEVESKEVFEGFYEQYLLTSDERFATKIIETGEVFEALKLFKRDFRADDYVANDRKKVNDIINDVIDSIKITTNFSRDGLIEIIDLASIKIATEFKTAREYFDEAKIDAIAQLDGLKTDALRINAENPQCSVSNVVGFLDADAVLQVDAVYNEWLPKLDGVTYVNVDSSAVFASMLDEAEFDFEIIPKNDIERAINAISDYNAALGGYINNITPEGAKLIAKGLCESARDEIILLANQEVIANYDNQISQIMTFLSDEFVEPTYDPSPKSVVQTADGVIKITAYVAIPDVFDNNVFTEYDIFPRNAEVIAYASTNSAGKANSQKAINNLNSKLDVGYFVYIDVFDGSKAWEAVQKTKEGYSILYRVEFDLKQYYINYVANYDGFIESIFKDVPFLQSKFVGKDKFDLIVKANEYINDLKDSDSSLIYSYYREDGKGVVSALNFSLNAETGIIMFDTLSFGTFSFTIFDDGNLLTNPLFWICMLLLVVLLIIVIALIANRAREIYIFDSKGGSKVDSFKVKKGDSFPMPSAPIKEGYIFGGWFIDEECTIRFIDTIAKSKKKKTVYAKWYENLIPSKYVKYFVELKNYISGFAKVGKTSDLGLYQSEMLATLFADKDGVKLNLKADATHLIEYGYNVTKCEEDAEFVFANVTNKQELNEAKQLIDLIMIDNGLQFVGLSQEYQAMTVSDIEEGFEFVVESPRACETIDDIFEYLRVYATSFALFNPPSDVKNGEMLARMFATDDAVEVYLNMPLGEKVLNAIDRFEDTCALVRVCVVEDVKFACDLIKQVMLSRGFEKNNDIGDIDLKKLENGNGCAYRISL